MTEHYDVVIVGAGIHGAGVAQAAAARGHRVLVLEQIAPASGTSGRSSKLIHGGLRYLESGQFSLVHECLRERRILLRIAPDLVQLKPFIIPVYRRTQRRPWQIALGLSAYALLGGMAADYRFARIARGDWSVLDGLDMQDLEQVFSYYDAQTDDAALTRAVLRSAMALGARCECPARFVRAERHAAGVDVHYQIGATTHACKARVLVNAAGPWVNEVLALCAPAIEAVAVELVQGTHIIVPGMLHAGLYYLEAPQDRRAVFVMPWQGDILIGTTETVYHGAPQDVRPLATELDYLLATYARYFTAGRALMRADIINTFSGLRVLPAGRGAAFGRPRELRLHCDSEQRPRVLTLYGGKLTVYRATAQRVVERLAAQLPTSRKSLDTARLPLTPVG